MRKFLFTVLAVSFILGCGNKAAVNNTGETLLLNLKEEGKSYDPQLANDATGEFVDSLVGEGLTRQGKDGKSIPGIAEKWETSDDGLVWTFYLRKNAKWSNGDTITANDFKEGWLRALKPETAAEYAFMLFPIKNAEEYNTGKAKVEDVGIKVVNNYTLEVILKAPVTYFDSLVRVQTYLPLNSKFYDSVKEKYMTSVDTSISSGAYIIKSWTRDSDIIFEKNPNYWNKDAIKLEKIQAKFINDAASDLNAFKNGETDVTNISVQQLKEFREDPRLKYTNDGSVWYVIFNMKNKVLSNKKIRQALSLAIDKEEMVRGVLNGIGSAAYTYTPKNIGIIGVDKDFALEAGEIFPKYNIEEAKRLLSEGMKELGITEFPELDMIFNDSGNNKIITEFIQENFRKNLGINIKISSMTFQERLARMEQKDFDLVLAGFAGDYNDAISYLERFESTNGNNYSQYVNPEYDKLVKKVKTSANQKERVEAMIQMEKIIGEDMPVGLLYNRMQIKLVNPRVKEIQFNAIGKDYNLDETYIQK